MRAGRKARLWRAVSCMFLALLVCARWCEADIPPSEYWKNTIAFPDEPFRAISTDSHDPGWVKFTILLEPYDANVVYFQDCREYKFHYDFATDLLTPFLGMTPAHFDAVTLYEQGQAAVLGAVIMPPNGGVPKPFEFPEYGIQLVRRDPYTKEQVAELFELVKSKIVAAPGVKAFYFPTYEQMPIAETYKEWFESQGIPVGSAARWSPGNSCYSTGWALGELKYFQGNSIDYAYRTGLLEPNDILLTDGVPAEVPSVAGIITLSPSTPNSHVAILARTFGVPFAYLSVAEDAERAEQLVGRRVVLRAFEKWYDWDVALINVEDVLDEETIAEVLTLKAPAQLQIQPMADYGAYSASTEGLGPSDIKCFGGKAANFGILRRSITDNSPVAAAFSFNLWNEYLDQTIATGRTLRGEIDKLLSAYTYPPENMAMLSNDLAYIRDLFTTTYITSFTQGQKDAVIGILQDQQYGFDPERKIRFRSSTNVEDSNAFTGAGLYESYSGCLADDLDGDNSGPCLCDPTEAKERGVFRAIRKVFASFYNDNAFLERLRYDVNERDVGMALLVHHSFPDEIELANGVAIVEKRQESNWLINLVTQLGAISVANPEDGSIPEEVEVSYGPWINMDLVCSSNLVQLGGTVLVWRDEYEQLAGLLAAAAQEFTAVTAKSRPVLDFEYKKVAPDGKLVVKQIREIPQSEDVRSVTPLLINQPLEFHTLQGEFGTVFANHRLKSRWIFETKNTWLTMENLAECFYSNVSLEYNDSGRIRSVSGQLRSWPFFDWAVVERATGYQVDTSAAWLMHHLANPRSCKLNVEQTAILVSPAENPMLTFADLGRPRLDVQYDAPVETRNSTGRATTETESIWLVRPPKPQPDDIPQERHIILPQAGISIDTSFYWPPTPKGQHAGYTSPLIRWVETVIQGLATEPIVLKGWHSQTYHAGTHNITEEFLFGPGLEPDMSANVLHQLRAKDVRTIYAHIQYDFGSGECFVLDEDIYRFDQNPFLGADIDGDKDVDFADLALLGHQWRQSFCDTCGGADLTGDGRVSPSDLREICDSWLATIE